MKTAAASVISASASAPPIWNRSRKTSEVLRKLSLNAAKNWVQNRGAKRRVISRDEDMAFPLVQWARGPHARQTLVRSAPSPRKRSTAGRGMGRGALREGAPHPIEIMANTIVPSPRRKRVHARLQRAMPGRGHVPRRRPTGGADGLRDDNLGKRTITRRGRAKRRHWRDANGDHAQNKGGRPGAARRSGPAMFDFAIGAEAAG